MSLSVITISGRLATDPTANEVNGSTVVAFNVAVNLPKKDPSGANVAMFHRVSAWGKLGERCLTYLHKGDPVMLIGDFSQRDYTDDKGNPRQQNQIKATNVEFLGGNRAGAQSTPAQKPAAAAKATQPAVNQEEDELPF